MKYSVSLTSNRIFRRLYSKGKQAVSPYMVIYCRRNSTQQTRLGITVSTKLGCAVYRNRIRRRFREIYRTNEHRLTPGWDIVVVARSASGRANYWDMEADFIRLAGTLGIKDEKASDSSD